MEIKRQLKDAGSPDSESDTEIVDGKKSCGLKSTCNIDKMSDDEFYAMSTEVRSTHVAAYKVGSKNVVLPSLTESSDDSPKCGFTQRLSRKPDILGVVSQVLEMFNPSASVQLFDGRF